jgi:tyrosinase
MAPSPWLQPFLLLPIIGFFCSFSACSPVDADIPEDSFLLKRQQNGVFVTLGMGAFADRTPHPRLEIRELEKNKDQWNVFLLGLSRFQSIDQNEKLSYFQVAGESICPIDLIKHDRVQRCI